MNDFALSPLKKSINSQSTENNCNANALKDNQGVSLAY